MPLRAPQKTVPVLQRDQMPSAIVAVQERRAAMLLLPFRSPSEQEHRGARRPYNG
jgi:hypothetical protein